MEYEYIDIHCHPNFSDYDADREEMLQKMKDEKVLGICVGTDIDTSRESAVLAEKYENLFASVGVHPTHATLFDDENMTALVSMPKVVAIGECGLDYFRKDATEEEKTLQKKVFTKHIEIAVKNNLPLMIHCRPSKGTMDAYEDVLDILSPYQERGVKGNVHFFVGSKDIAQRFLDIGFSMSFTGVITFTNDYDEVIKMLPLSRIMSETDSPYVAPVPYRGKRNEPLFVKEVVKRIAEIRGEPEGVVKEAILANAKSFFGLKFVE